MKRKTESQKRNKLRTKKINIRNKPESKKSKSIAVKVINEFIRWNIIGDLVIAIIYFFLYLLSRIRAGVSDIYYSILTSFFSDENSVSFFYNNSILLLLIGFFGIFLLNFFIFSCWTLSVFNKTYKSLDSFMDDNNEIASFSKQFSDVEIKLKDIKLDVLSNKQLAIQSESKKNDLVMYLAHDLKTPLTSVIGYLTLLQECPELPLEMRAKYTDICLEKALRLEQLITEFFEITRFNIQNISLQKNRIDLNMMLAQIVDEFYPMLSSKNLSTDIDIPQKIVMFADSDKIARVFDNLLKNAVNYSYENSMIRIGARVRENRVIIKFRNKCDEIPEEKLERLFDKFYRADSSRGSASGGSGLGLAIAKQITELHGGTIKAKSNEDYTDFTVVLPFRDATMTENEKIDF